MEFQDELSGVFLCCSAECDALKSVLANRLEVGFLAGAAHRTPRLAIVWAWGRADVPQSLFMKSSVICCFVLTLSTVALFKKRERGAPKCHN